MSEWTPCCEKFQELLKENLITKGFMGHFWSVFGKVGVAEIDYCPFCGRYLHAKGKAPQKAAHYE